MSSFVAEILPLKLRIFYSLRLGGWSKVFIPVFLGQIIGAVHLQNFSLTHFFFGFLQGLFLLLSIIFSNDLADEKVDRIKRQMYPLQSSPKTLTDNLLPRRLVYFMALFFPSLFLFCGFFFIESLGRSYLGYYSFIIILSYAYSFPPFRLNYRFGGELLEAFGIGFCLPCYNAYLQSSLLWQDNYFFFLSFFFIALSHAICSGICDKNSDVLGGKKTFSVFFGNKQTILIIFIVLLWSLGTHILPYWLLVLNSFILLGSFAKYKSFYNSKIEDDILEQKKFRIFLHKTTSLMIFVQTAYFLYLLI